MSLAAICHNVADDLGINLPVGAIVGNRAEAPRRIFQAARRAAWSLFNETAWVALTVEHVFSAADAIPADAGGAFVVGGPSLVGGPDVLGDAPPPPPASDFALPPDFDRLVADTLWERSRYWSLRGAMSPQQWQVYRSSIYGRATIERRWRIRIPSGKGVGNPARFSLDPPLRAGDEAARFVFEYVSSWWCRGADGTMKPDWTADNDTALFDETLLELGVRWRMLRRLGLAYDDDQAEYKAQLQQQIARDGGTAILSLVPSSRTVFIGPYNVPDTGFGPVP